jgi:hypothetical protein
MKDLVYIVSWSFLFVSASAISEFVVGKPGSFDMAVFWKKTETHKIVRFIAFMIMVLTGALVIWGWCNLSWYAALLEFFAGFIISPLGLHLNPVPRMYFGWVILLAAVLWLWTRT